MSTRTETYIARVHALLDKAESTPYEAEAEALLAKAQELMARHAIDEAMLSASSAAADDIGHVARVIVAPYANAKSTLLGAVARANRCRAVVEHSARGNIHATVVGHLTDLEHVDLLFASLSLQAVRAMRAAPVPPGDTARRFRHAFLLAYAHRIGERLRAVEAAAERAAQDAQRHQPGGRSVSLVLTSREAKVERALSDRFGPLRTKQISSSSGAGHRSGRQAADQASLDQRPLGGHLRGLPGG